MISTRTMYFTETLKQNLRPVSVLNYRTEYAFQVSLSIFFI